MLWQQLQQSSEGVVNHVGFFTNWSSMTALSETKSRTQKFNYTESIEQFELKGNF